MHSPADPSRTHRRRWLASLTSLTACSLLPAVPRAAAAEGVVRVASTTDLPAAQALIEAFEGAHAPLRVRYHELGSMALDAVAGDARAAPFDVLWSSAMDRQIKLVNDGRAMRHVSPHAEALPRWAVWRHEAYATTLEPACTVVRRAAAGARAAPATHADLLALLADPAARLKGRVASYDIERAGLGFLFAAWDVMVWPRAWDLWRALGAASVRLHADTQGMLDAMAEGLVDVAYNVLGPYAEVFVRRHPQFLVVYPSDYTLVASRVAFIARNAPNPEGARKWLDFLLSRPGQQALAEGGGLHPLRRDATAQPGWLEQRLGRAARPIALGPGLMAHLDQHKRQAFLKRWRQALGHG